RDLPELAVQGGAVLAHQGHRPVVVEGQDTDRARVVDDLPVEAGIVGAGDLGDRDRDAPPLPDGLLAGDPEGRSGVVRVGGTGCRPLRSAAAHGAARTGATSSGTGNRWGLRPSARSSAAATSSRNSGAGLLGRLLNSGWAWVPTQNGWSASSMNST